MTQFQETVSNETTFKITEKQYLQAMQRNMRMTWRVVIGIMLAMSLAYLVLGEVATGVGMLVFFVLYFGLLQIITRYKFRKIYKGMPQLHGDQTIQFSEDGLVWHNAYALSKVKWQLYQKFDVDKDMYLLYQGPHLFNMIPRSAFHSDDQEAAFRMVLELNVHPATKRKRPRQR